MERKNRSQNNEAILLPFSGLGLALSCVDTRARVSKLVPIAASYESTPPKLQPEFAPVCNGYGSGFKLLIALGREIRGR